MAKSKSPKKSNREIHARPTSSKNVKKIKKILIKKSRIKKFLLVLGTFFIFLLFMLNKYGFEQGIEITLLVWTFFVLCTPLAIADLLLDVPMRLVLKNRMTHSHAIVWGFAISINLLALHFSPSLYEVSPLLIALHFILTNPIPYWGLMGLCLIGTFLSLEIADEVVDEVENKMHLKRHAHHSALHFIILALLIAGILLIYDMLLGELNFQIKQFF